jgi:hypothetical protein
VTTWVCPNLRITNFPFILPLNHSNYFYRIYEKCDGDGRAGEKNAYKSFAYMQALHYLIAN